MIKVLISYYPGIKLGLMGEVSLRKSKIMNLYAIRNPEFNEEGGFYSYSSVAGSFGTDLSMAMRFIHQEMEEAALRVDGR